MTGGRWNEEPYSLRPENRGRTEKNTNSWRHCLRCRRKRTLKQAADLYLSLPVTDRRVRNKIARDGVNPEDIDNQMAMIVGLTEAAVRGDARCAKVLVDLLGDSTVEEPTPDDGFMDALREEAGQIWQED